MGGGNDGLCFKSFRRLRRLGSGFREMVKTDFDSVFERNERDNNSITRDGEKKRSEIMYTIAILFQRF